MGAFAPARYDPCFYRGLIFVTNQINYMSLFAEAKKAAPQASSKATTKTIVKVELGDKLRRLQDQRNQIAVLEANNAILEGDIRPVARDEFIKLMRQQNRRPDSFIIQSAGSNMLVIVQDRYLKMTEPKESALRENKLDSVIDEKVVYAFNPVILEKYEKQISKALESLKIPEDLGPLITASVAKSVLKGTIEILPTFKNPRLVFDLIEPQMQLKNQE